MNCKQPDRDVPALVCGYPIPCPHHTLMFTMDNIGDALPTLEWLRKYPNLSIAHSVYVPAHGEPQIAVRAIAYHELVEVWSAERLLAFNSPMSALRDAFDELTREGHLALEGKRG